MRHSLTACACVLLAASPCLAQHPAAPSGEPGIAALTEKGFPVKVGDVVRLRLAGPSKTTETGTVAAIDHDSLTLQPAWIEGRDSERPKDVRRHAFGSVSRIEIHTGRHRATGRGALIGAATVGVLVGILEATACASDEWGCSYGLGTAVYAAAGGGVGALIGSAFQVDTWEKVNLPPRGPDRATNLPHGASLQVTLRF